MDEYLPTNPLQGSEYLSRKAENLRREEEVIQRLLSGQQTRVYHKLAKEEDFGSLQENGPKGSYSLLVDDTKHYLSYYTLLSPTVFSAQHVTLSLNKPGEVPLKIFDARNPGFKVDRQALIQLIKDGYDGQIETAGAIVPMELKYQLKIFNGEKLIGKFEKAKKDNPISPSVV